MREHGPSSTVQGAAPLLVRHSTVIGATFHPEPAQGSLAARDTVGVNDRSPTRTAERVVMVATDLDGTLLGSDRRISAANLRALEVLGERGIVRVIATGRSRFSAERALARDLPLDYLVVSSGAGIIEFGTQRYLHTEELTPAQTDVAAAICVERGLDFMVHDPIPDNHRFAFHRARGRADFERRVAFYREHCRPERPPYGRAACQLLAVHDADESHVEAITQALPEHTVLRATSPLDHRSVWVEIFPPTVSKSRACAWIAARHRVPVSQVLAIGNDTNDIDLLRWAGRAVAVGDAHPELRREFSLVAAHDDDGFAEAVAGLA